MLKQFFPPLLILTCLGCDHPISIIGEGDVISASGNRDCTLEDFRAGRESCTRNTIQGDYQEVYTARPRAGWEFSRWENYCLYGKNGDN